MPYFDKALAIDPTNTYALKYKRMVVDKLREKNKII